MQCWASLVILFIINNNKMANARLNLYDEEAAAAAPPAMMELMLPINCMHRTYTKYKRIYAFYCLFSHSIPSNKFIKY